MRAIVRATHKPAMTGTQPPAPGRVGTARFPRLECARFHCCRAASVTCHRPVTRDSTPASPWRDPGAAERKLAGSTSTRLESLKTRLGWRRHFLQEYAISQFLDG